MSRSLLQSALSRGKHGNGSYQLKAMTELWPFTVASVEFISADRGGNATQSPAPLQNTSTETLQTEEARQRQITAV